MPRNAFTLSEAKARAQIYSCSLTKRDNEYRVCPYGGTEEQAYYTDCIEDAVMSAAMMHINTQTKYANK